MAMPIAASTVTTVVVFLPLVLFIRGLASELFKDMAFTVTFSLLASLLVALTVVPMLSSRVKKFKVRRKLNPLKDVENELRARGRVMRALDTAYGAVLGLAVRHRAAAIGLILAFFLSSLMLIPRMGIEFMPASDEGQVEVVVQTPVGSNLETTRRAVDRLYRIVQEAVPEAENTLVQVGRAGGGGFGAEAQNTGSVWLFLKDVKERERSTQEVADALRQPASRIPGTTVRFNTQSGMTGGGGLTVSVKGYELASGQELAGKIRAILQKQPNVRDVRISREEGLPEYRIRVDRERAAQYGLNASTVGATIKRAFAGESVAKAILGGEEVDVRARLREQDRLNATDLERISIATPAGVMVPLANLVSLERTFGPQQIQREAQQRVVRVEAAVQGDMARIVARVHQEVDRLTIPPGFTVLYGGSYEDLQKTIRELAMVLLLSIVLVYLVMAAQFESFFDPFIIMFTLPMTVSGVIWIHLLTGITFSAISGIGVLVLLGIVVNNGIILVDYTNLLRKRGYPILDAVQLAGRSRLRPILMTVLTTILGLIPLAVTSGNSAEMEMPMARTIIGGLTVSTVFTLLLIPALYAAFEVGKERRRRKREERREVRQARRQEREERRARAAAATRAARKALLEEAGGGGGRAGIDG
jgi:HAE1 family hydrophobic/amphiphilic exporter-1